MAPGRRQRQRGPTLNRKPGHREATGTVAAGELTSFNQAERQFQLGEWK